MGIFSSLFDKSNRQSKSNVKDWAERRRNELRHSDDVTPEYLFAAIIFGLTSFGKKDHRRKRSIKLGTYSSEHYSSDAALFELGCYLYFRLDIYGSS